MKSRKAEYYLTCEDIEVLKADESSEKMSAYPVDIVEESVDLAYIEGYNTALEDLMNYGIEALRNQARDLKY